MGRKRAATLSPFRCSHERHEGSSGCATARPPRMLLTLSRPDLLSASLFRDGQRLISGPPLGLRPRRQADDSTSLGGVVSPACIIGRATIRNLP